MWVIKPSGFADDGTSRNPYSVVYGNVAPNEPPTRDEVVEGEARANFQNTHSYQKIIHGQPPTSYSVSKIFKSISFNSTRNFIDFFKILSISIVLFSKLAD